MPPSAAPESGPTAADPSPVRDSGRDSGIPGAGATPTGSRWTGLERLTVALLLALHASLAFVQRAPAVTTGHDDALYLLLAREVAHGSYRDRHLPGAPWHRQYPPGYPALLAAGRTVLGQEPGRLALLGIACSTAALLVVYVSARAVAPVQVAMATLVLSSINPFLVAQAGRIASESLFMLLVALALWLLLPFGRAGARAWIPTVAAAFTRSAGLPFAGALVVHEVIGRRWRRAALAIVLALVPAAAWAAFSLGRADDAVVSSYASDVERLAGARQESTGVVQREGLPESAVARSVLNAVLYVQSNVPTLLPVPALAGTRVDNAVWLVAIVACMAAGLWWLRRRWSALPLFLAAYGALLVVWPWTVGRFALPVLPQLLLLFLLGAWVLASRALVRPLLVWLVPAVLIGVTASIETVATSRAASACDRSAPHDSPACFSSAQRDLFAAARVLAQDPTGGRVLTAKAGTVALLSGRPVLPSTSFLELPAAAAGSIGDQLGVRAVLIGHLHETDSEMAERLLPHCRRLREWRRFPDGALLFRFDVADAATDPAACRVLEARVAEPALTRPIGLW
jgi:hypothetical protein